MRECDAQSARALTQRHTHARSLSLTLSLSHTHTPKQVSGIEGSFRTTCENVMRVLRTHKESVTAMLEAFVHDPLINWRLLNTTEAQVRCVCGGGTVCVCVLI